MATPVLQFKRGAFSNLPALKAGEPGFTTDKFDFYIGLDNQLANNKFFGSTRYWKKETETTGSGLNLVEGTNNGTDFITIQSPASLAGVVTYTLPGTQGSENSILQNDGLGGLSWATSIDNLTLTDVVLTGITTIGETNLDVNASAVDFSGIVTFSNTTQSTDKDTGAVVVEGGVGIEKNLSVGGATTITGNLFVGGTSEFIGVATFRGGTINLGDADTDDINVGGEFISDLLANDDDSYDIGRGPDKRWRHANFSGVGTFAVGAVVDAIQIGITAASEIDTSAGDLTLDSAAGTVIVDDQLTVAGVSTFTGAIDANGGATIDNIQIGITDDNEIDTSSGNLTIDSAGGFTTIDDNLNVTGISTFADAIDANGGATINNIQIGVTGDNEIDTSTGNLTLDSNGGTVTVDDNLTVTTGNELVVTDLTNTRVLLAGASSQITDSADLTFTGNVLTVANTIDVTTVEVTNVKAKDGTTSITITDGNGNVGIASDLTVSGNLTVLGSQTEVNTETLLVEDSLIEVGLINSGGSLVPPSSDANIDVGVIFHYFDTAAKKAAVYWDDSVSRVSIASSVTEASSVLTANAYAALEIGALWVNDCAGQSQVISCTGSERFLENITIDGGSFT